MPRETCFRIFAMGMSAPGELAALTRLVRPHVAIVTAIAPAHRDFSARDEEIADAKGEIFEGLEAGVTAPVLFDIHALGRLTAAAAPPAGTTPHVASGGGPPLR